MKSKTFIIIANLKENQNTLYADRPRHFPDIKNLYNEHGFRKIRITIEEDESNDKPGIYWAKDKDDGR